MIKKKKQKPVESMLPIWYHIGVNSTKYSLKQWTSSMKELGISLKPFPCNETEQPILEPIVRDLNDNSCHNLVGCSLILVGKDVHFQENILGSIPCVEAEVYIAACRSKRAIQPISEFLWCPVMRTLKNGIKPLPKLKTDQHDLRKEDELSKNNFSLEIQVLGINTLLKDEPILRKGPGLYIIPEYQDDSANQNSLRDFVQRNHWKHEFLPSVNACLLSNVHIDQLSTLEFDGTKLGCSLCQFLLPEYKIQVFIVNLELDLNTEINQKSILEKIAAVAYGEDRSVEPWSYLVFGMSAPVDGHLDAFTSMQEMKPLQKTTSVEQKGSSGVSAGPILMSPNCMHRIIDCHPGVGLTVELLPFPPVMTSHRLLTPLNGQDETHMQALKAVHGLSWPPRPCNGYIVDMLRLMAKYEVAVGGKSEDKVSLRQLSKDQGAARFNESAVKGASLFEPKEAKKSGGFVNMRELAFERAAAMVASWPYPLNNKVQVQELAEHRPYIGAKMLQHITQAMDRGGRCSQLDDYEASHVQDGLGVAQSSGCGYGDAFSSQLRVLANAASVSQVSAVLGVSVGRGHWLFDDESDNEALESQSEAFLSEKTAANPRKRPRVGMSAHEFVRKGMTTPSAMLQQLPHLDAGNLLTDAQVFGIRSHEELRLKLSEAEVQEITSQLGGVLHSYESEPPSQLKNHDNDKGWLFQQCGGTRRGRGCGHDVDFLISHPALCSFHNTEHLLQFIVDKLESTNSLLPPTAHGGWQMKQSGRVRPSFQAPANLGAHQQVTRDIVRHYAQCSHIQKLKNRIKLSASGRQHWDMLDRIFGVWKLANGSLRRVDIIVVPFIEWPFALLSWTGSKVFNRLLRHLANTKGLSLSAHCLLTVPRHQAQLNKQTSLEASNSTVDMSSSSIHEMDMEPLLVPYETGSEIVATVKTERDIFELLGLPWIPPHLRNA